MPKITVRCDRCGKMVEGARIPMPDGSVYFTAGFFETGGLPWSQMADEGENIVCDACMWADPRYQAVYGVSPYDPTSAA